MGAPNVPFPNNIISAFPIIIEVASSGILHVNLETQAKLLDKLLERYGFFQDDVDVNGLRVKMIASEFLKRIKAAGMTDLVRQKEKDARWKMLW